MKVGPIPLRDTWLNLINAVTTLETEDIITSRTSNHMIDMLMRFKDIIEDHDVEWDKMVEKGEM